MTVYEDARARVKMFFEILSLAQPDSAGMREFGVPQEVVDALGILTQVPESPVVNLVSDSYRGTNATGIRLGELEQAVRAMQDQANLLTERIRDLEALRAETRVITRRESDYGGMQGGGDLPGPEDVACRKCGSYAVDHENGPDRAYQFCPDRPVAS